MRQPVSLCISSRSRLSTQERNPLSGTVNGGGHPKLICQNLECAATPLNQLAMFSLCWPFKHTCHSNYEQNTVQ